MGPRTLARPPAAPPATVRTAPYASRYVLPRRTDLRLCELQCLAVMTQLAEIWLPAQRTSVPAASNEIWAAAGAANMEVGLPPATFRFMVLSPLPSPVAAGYPSPVGAAAAGRGASSAAATAIAARALAVFKNSLLRKGPDGRQWSFCGHARLMPGRRTRLRP